MRSALAGVRGAVLVLGLGVQALQAPLARAQVPQEVRELLARSGVATGGGHVYARVSGPLRGTREASEDLYATRAMRAVAASLCGFEPGPGRALEAGVAGFTLVASSLRGREVEVVMRAPVQKPVCRVVTAPLPVPALAAPAVPAAPAPAPAPVIEPSQPQAAEAATRLIEPSYIRSSDMTVRIFGGDY